MDTVFEYCQRRNILVERNTNFLHGITKNQTLIDYTSKYTNLIATKGKINQVQRYKHVLLPMELFRTSGKKPRNYATDRCKKSPLKWEFHKTEYDYLQKLS